MKYSHLCAFGKCRRLKKTKQGKFEQILILKFLVNPSYWHPEISNTARICDVIVKHSPFGYVHWFSQNIISKDCSKGNCPDSFRNDAELILPCHTKKKYTGGNIIVDENEKKKRTCT